MVASPVLMQAEGVLRPSFDRFVGNGKPFGGAVEFRVVSEPVKGTGQRKYLAAAQLLWLKYRFDKKKVRAIRSLRQAFDESQKKGDIPASAQFGVSEVVYQGRTLRWALAILPCCGDFVATPTICD